MRGPATGLILAALLMAGPVRAEPNPRAARHADRAIRFYNAGRFDQAIEEYQQAYEIDPDPLLLYNLAQAHRQKGDSERAIFFYRRYLQMAPEATDRDQVQKKIADLERAQPVRPPAASVLPPPARTQPAPLAAAPAPLATPPTATAVLPEPPVAVDEEIEEGPAFRLSLSGGAALPHFSGTGLAVPLLGSVRAAAQAALPAGSGTLDLGAAAALIPIPYDPVGRGSTAGQSLSFLIGLYAAAGYRLPLSGAFSLGGEADLGMGVWTGLDQGNPFTRNNEGTSGALPLPSLRLAVTVLYRVSRPIWLWLGPSYQLALPVSAGLKETVSAVHLFELAAGVAVQL